MIAASNSFDDGIHAAGHVPASGTTDLRWRITDDVADQSELEIWYPGADRLAAEIIRPDGMSLGVVRRGETRDSATTTARRCCSPGTAARTR